MKEKWIETQPGIFILEGHYFREGEDMTTKKKKKATIHEVTTTHIEFGGDDFQVNLLEGGEVRIKLDCGDTFDMHPDLWPVMKAAIDKAFKG